jgi:hypothetical protein
MHERSDMRDHTKDPHIAALMRATLAASWGERSDTVIACDKREAFAQGSEPTKQSIYHRTEIWIGSQ